MSRPRSELGSKLTMNSVPTGDGKLSAVHFSMGLGQGNNHGESSWTWREKLPAFLYS